MGNKKFWTEGYGSFAIAILIALSIRWALMEAYVIPSASMLPSLLIHDHIFVNKLVYGIRVPFSEDWLVKFRLPTRGEVIVFKYPLDKSTFFIKRVVGVPGDHISYDSGKFMINDQVIPNEPAATEEDFDELRAGDFQGGDGPDNYLHLREKLTSEITHPIMIRKGDNPYPLNGAWTVPDGKLFVMGDNRDNSADSRKWLWVPEENILGRAMFVWLSCEDTLPYLSFLCNPLELRWGRFFHQVK